MSALRLSSFALMAAISCAPASAQDVKLLLFGGDGHTVFLGCLNCAAFDSSSVCNQYGRFGSKYQDNIWSRYGTYGGKYSAHSPWAMYAVTPPVIVDRSGNFYGYMTVTESHPKRTRIASILRLLSMVASDDDLDAAADLYCQR